MLLATLVGVFNIFLLVQDIVTCDVIFQTAVILPVEYVGI